MNDEEFVRLEEDVKDILILYRDECAERDIDYDMSVEDIMQEVQDSE